MRKIFLVSLIILSIEGLIFIFSTTSIRGEMIYGDAYLFLKKQLIAVVIGFLLFGISQRINFIRFGNIFFILCFTLTILTLFGKGSIKRWLHLPGFSFQPVEMLKISWVIFCARYLSKDKEFLPLIIFSVFIFSLVALQPDFGNAFLILLSTLFLIFIVGIKIRYIFFASIPIFLIAIGIFILEPYRIERIKTFLNPWENRTTKGYQIVQSILSYASGGINGVGIGSGTQKLFFLPAAHTDLIISSIAEEGGLILVAFTTLLYILIYSIGFISAIKYKEEMENFFLVSGLTFLLSIQTAINLLVSVGLFPTKGFTLPFLSYGGSSLISSLLSAGIIYSKIK